MKRIIIFILLKVLEMGAPILVFMYSEHVTMLLAPEYTGEAIWEMRILGFLIIVIMSLVTILVCVAVPSFIKANWEQAKKIADKL